MGESGVVRGVMVDASPQPSLKLRISPVVRGSTHETGTAGVSVIRPDGEWLCAGKKLSEAICSVQQTDNTH